MKMNLKKLKAILGTSLTGTGIGVLLSSAVFGAGAILFPGQMTLGNLLDVAALMGSFGAFAAGGFATMLALTKGGDGVANLSVARSAILGLIAGGLFPIAVSLLAGSGGTPVALIAIFGILGCGVTAGLVAVAKDAHARISPPSSERLLESGEPI